MKTIKTTRRTRMATAVAAVLLAPSTALAQVSMADGGVQLSYKHFSDNDALEPPRPARSVSQEDYVTAEILATTEEQVRFAQEAGIAAMTGTGAPVTAEIPADQVESLRETGLEVEIINRFLAIKVSPGERESRPWPEGEGAGPGPRACEENVVGANLVDVPIPDDPACCGCFPSGEVSSTFSVSGYPGETVCNVKYRVRIVHAYVSDIYARLTNDYGLGPVIWNHHGVATDNGQDDDAADDDDIYLEWRPTNAFNGDPVHQGWQLFVRDDCPLDTGYIDYFQLRIFYGKEVCLEPRPYGDVTPFESITPPCPGYIAELGDGFANMLDVFCAFNAFNEGNPYTQCPCADVAPCGGDTFVNMLDVYAIFNAFNDSPACSDPCP